MSSFAEKKTNKLAKENLREVWAVFVWGITVACLTGTTGTNNVLALAALVVGMWSVWGFAIMGLLLLFYCYCCGCVA
jgi:uncharacterized MAPEG superfamily protein